MEKGFSLIEIIVVVAIAATVILVVGNFGNNIAGLNQLVTLELDAKSDVNQTLQTMVKEVQSAAPSANGGYPITTASTSSFAFYSDINKTGITEYVDYFYASSTIYREVIMASGTPATYPTSSAIVRAVISNVVIPSSTPLFSYYDSNYTGSQAALTYPIGISSIRLVGIAFEINVNQTTTTAPAAPQYFSSLVDLRNLDSN